MPLPKTPNKLLQIDETTLDQHGLLERSDRCFYLWEYTPHADFHVSPANDLILNLKKKPSQLASNPAEAKWKHRAMRHAARALSEVIPLQEVQTLGTIVPVPPSKADGHPDFDDRLLYILRRAWGQSGGQCRGLLRQTRSTESDHEGKLRQWFNELLRTTEIDESQVPQEIGAQITVFDDVLTSGKHFKVAQRLLSARFPDTPIVGLFLARCLHTPPDAAAARRHACR